ncbi:2214_t:CDS:2, partial [Acaulospora morrowiae]
QEEKGISTKDVSRSPVNSNDTPASNISDNTSNSNITPERIENISDIRSDSDTYQKKNSRSSTSSITIKTASSEEKKINDFLDSVHKETISEKIREKNREKNLRSQDKDKAPSDTNFKKLCDAIILADRKTQEAIA